MSILDLVESQLGRPLHPEEVDLVIRVQKHGVQDVTRIIALLEPIVPPDSEGVVRRYEPAGPNEVREI